MLKCSMATECWTIFNSGQKWPTFLSPFDAVQPGVALDALNRFDQYWNNPSQGFQTRTYIASISEHDPSEDRHGRLWMWASFRRKRFGPRFAMVFRVPRYSEALGFLRYRVSPVAYLSQRARVGMDGRITRTSVASRGFSGTLTRAEFSNWVFGTLALAVTCVKHERLAGEEREWRILYLPGLLPAGTASHLEEEVRSIGSLPQVIYKLPIDAGVTPQLAHIDFTTMFDRLIFVGPSAHPVGHVRGLHTRPCNRRRGKMRLSAWSRPTSPSELSGFEISHC